MGQTNSSVEGKGYDNTLDFAARFDNALHRFRFTVMVQIWEEVPKNFFMR